MKKCIAIGYLLLVIAISSQALVTLSIDTVGPHSNVTCPLTSLTCTAVNIPGSDIRWFVGEESVTYTSEPSDVYPLQLQVPSDLTGVMMIQITDASLNGSSGTANFLSNLSVNVSALMNAGVTEISCGNLFSRSSQVTLHRTTPPPPPTNCSLLPSPGGVNISLQWSPPFTSQYAVERYHVSVNPDPSSCSSDLVSTSEDYSCSGLVLGTHYIFTVSTINCGDQEGERHTITAFAQEPQSPENLAVVPVYTSSLSNLTEIRLKWNAPETVQSGTCVDNNTEYTVYLMRGSVVNQTSLSSSDCSSYGSCSISYSPNTYLQNDDPVDNITISACNTIKCRNISFSGDVGHAQLSNFEPTLTFNCTTTVICPSPGGEEGSCTVQCTEDENYQQLSLPLIISFNNRTELQLESDTRYYFQITIVVPNMTYILRKNFTTGSIEPPLTTSNRVLLIISVFMVQIVLLMYICLFICLAVRAYKKSKDQDNLLRFPMPRCALLLLLSVLSLLFWIVSTVLCVAIGVYVGTEDDTCDLNWQSTRDKLITSTLVLALLSLLFVLMVLLAALVRRNRNFGEKERHFGDKEPEREQFKDVQACPICEKEFGKFVKSRTTAICNACGKVVCKDCCKQEAYLPYLKKSGNVCDLCYVTYQEQAGERGRQKKEDVNVNETGQTIKLKSRPEKGEDERVSSSHKNTRNNASQSTKL